MGLFGPEEIRSLQNNKSAATQRSFYFLLNILLMIILGIQ